MSGPVVTVVAAATRLLTAATRLSTTARGTLTEAGVGGSRDTGLLSAGSLSDGYCLDGSRLRGKLCRSEDDPLSGLCMWELTPQVSVPAWTVLPFPPFLLGEGMAEAERARERRATRKALGYMVLDNLKNNDRSRERVKELRCELERKRPRVVLQRTVGTGLKESERQLEQRREREGKEWGSAKNTGGYIHAPGCTRRLGPTSEDSTDLVTLPTLDPLSSRARPVVREIFLYPGCRLPADNGC